MFDDSTEGREGGEVKGGKERGREGRGDCITQWPAKVQLVFTQSDLLATPSIRAVRANLSHLHITN